MIKVRIKVNGRVQGVGFRFMTKMVADQIGVFGIVRNEADGSVYIEANGEEKKMLAFIQAIKNSPSPSGRVTEFNLSYDDTLPERTTFTVTYS